MTTKDILNLLDPKRQNLPSIEFRGNFKGCNLVIVPVVEGEEKAVKKAFPVPLFATLNGKKGEKAEFIKNGQVFRFIGIGPRKNMNSRTMRRFFGAAYLGAMSMKPKSIGLEVPFEWIKEAAVGIRVAALNPGILKSKPKKDKAPAVVFGSKSYAKNLGEAKKALKDGMVLAEAKNMMRVLGALPPNLLNQKTYADLAVELAKEWGVACKRLTDKEREPYQLLNAVSAGSANHSELVILTLHPKEGPSKKSVAVIGKGLCYDSGGLQGKQNNMKFMKEDMSGSGSVLSTVCAIVKGGAEVKQTTHFLLGMAENMMGTGAMRADDIYTAGDGQTVEILHTDAEGRLVLADVICYAKKELKNVERYYTIATLTGHCVIALGELYTGMVCNNEAVAKEVAEAGQAVGEYVHAGPWDLEFDDNNSPNADIASQGENSRDAGWIKAGLFIYRFVPKAKNEKDQVPFVHLDIAGSIDMYETGKAWRAKGLNSGVGVGLFKKLLTK
jgi:leucyl aminopeptidase